MQVEEITHTVAVMIDIPVGYQGHLVIEVGFQDGAHTIITAEELVPAMRGKTRILENEVMMYMTVSLVPGFRIHQERRLFLVVGVSHGNG